MLLLTRALRAGLGVVLPMALAMMVTACPKDRGDQRGDEPATPLPAPPDTAPQPTASTSARSVPIPETLKLSAAAGEAVQTLANSPHFGGWAVGVAGTPTHPVRAWRVLIGEQHAAEALALVLKHGTMAGQLMALAGLYLTDRPRFDREVARYKALDEKVSLMTSGCSAGGDPTRVRDIVETAGAVQLSGPDDSLIEWGKHNPDKAVKFDIIGGGYAAVMRPYTAPASPSSKPSAGAHPPNGTR